MNRDELLKLRGEVVSSARTLALESQADPRDKLDVIMSLIRSGDKTPDLMYQSYEIAKQLGSDEQKLNAMLDIIYEIDTELTDGEDQVGDGRASSVDTIEPQQ